MLVIAMDDNDNKFGYVDFSDDDDKGGVDDEVHLRII